MGKPTDDTAAPIVGLVGRQQHFPGVPNMEEKGVYKCHSATLGKSTCSPLQGLAVPGDLCHHTAIFFSALSVSGME